MTGKKLNVEIEKHLKRVSEGVTIVCEIFDKLNGNSNSSQKEKLEVDLKKEIKKLQRFREQIRVWLGSNDVKDKGVLEEARKLIEEQMVKFKAVEKSFRVKAFSKEGLQSGRTDPKIEEHDKMMEWLSDTVKDLEHQCETFEGELENLQAATKKGKHTYSTKQRRIEKIKEHIERHKWHISRLETIERLLFNEEIEVEPVKAIMDDINQYVNSNGESDNPPDDSIYQTLDINFASKYMPQNPELLLQALKTERETNPEASKNKNIPQGESQKDQKPLPTFFISIPNAANRDPARAARAQRAPETHTNSTSLKAATEEKQEIKKEPKKGTKNEIKPDEKTDPKPETEAENTLEKEKIEEKEQKQEPEKQEPQSKEERNEKEQNHVDECITVDKDLISQEFPEFLASYKSAKYRDYDNEKTINYIDQIFHDVFLNFSESADMNFSDMHFPECPYPSPPYYPLLPLSILSMPEIMDKFGVEVLFFIFYYCKISIVRHRAIMELNRRSWRYHTKLMKWFQRNGKPISVTDEYELGNYTYFENEEGWGKRNRPEFKFEYSCLDESDRRGTHIPENFA